MLVYRISKNKYIKDLSGTGAKLAGGRWNPKGFPVLYTSGSRALATLEVMVHIPAGFVPASFSLAVIWLPDASIESVPEAQLHPGWHSAVAPDYLKKFGSDWLQQGKTLTLKAPSAVVPGDFNFLVNPAHKRFAEVKVEHIEKFYFDERLELNLKLKQHDA